MSVLSLWRDLLAAWRRGLRPGPRGVSGLLALFAVLVTEVFGRRSGSLLSDLFWSVGLSASLATLAARWGVEPARLWGRLTRRWFFESGVDLRGQPPLPVRSPPVFARLARLALVALAVVLPLHPFFPSRARELALLVSPTLYFLGCALLMVSLPLFAATGVWIVHLSVANLVARTGSARLRRVVMTTSLGLHAMLMVLGAVLLPAWVPLGIVGVGALLSAAFVFSLPGWGLRLLWRDPARGREPVTHDAAHLAWASVWLVAATVVVLSVPLLGEHLWTASGEPSLSRILGLGFAWCGASIFAWVTCWQGRIAFLRRYRNPGRKRRVRVVVLGELPCARRDVVEPLRRAGFSVAFGDRAHRPVDVPLRFVEPVLERPGRWALSATARELSSPALHFRLRRRGSIRRRRQFLHGLHRMWKEARRLPRPQELGFWVGPHLWYVTALTRDGQEQEEVIEQGVPYHGWMPLEARAEAREVLDAAEIDLLFVERGVTSRGLRRVFEALFEYHDLFGGQRRAQERNFVGIPGVRVVIHDYQLGEPAADSGFAEPDYTSLGRARILHVSREEGGQEEREQEPDDRSGVPIFSGPASGGPLVHA